MLAISELVSSLQSRAEVFTGEKIRHYNQHRLKELTVGPPLLAPCVPLGTEDCGVSCLFFSAEQAK